MVDYAIMNVACVYLLRACGLPRERNQITKNAYVTRYYCYQLMKTKFHRRNYPQLQDTGKKGLGNPWIHNVDHPVWDGEDFSAKDSWIFKS